MGRKVINRTGEERLNNFGSKMVIKGYRGCMDIDVYFPEYNWTYKHGNYNNFKNGKVQCPYEPRTFGVGYIGEGKYKAKENGKHTDEYIIWHSMLMRCYDPKYQEKHPSYKGCRVEDYLLNFQHMGEWIESNYYEISGETMCLDKDILCKGNKIYSRETCIFVPSKINTLFIKCNKSRCKDPIGVYQLPSGNYQAYCNNGYGKLIKLGRKKNKGEAFRAYKSKKEKLIKDTID